MIPMSKSGQSMIFRQKSNFLSPHWFMISILGELHLFLPNITLKYHQSETKVTWTTIEPLMNLHIEDVEFLNVV